MVGLAFDVGFLEMMNRQAQTAADSAAVAGAISLSYGTADMNAGAIGAAAQNGFPSSSVTVHNPPSVGPYVGNSSFVEVFITQTEPTFFLRMIGAGSSSSVRARAVATNLAGDCIFALSPTAGPAGSSPSNYTSALYVGGNSLINVSGCGVEVDSKTAGSLWLYYGNILTNYLGDAASTYWCGDSTAPVGPENGPQGDPGCYDPSYPVVNMYPLPSAPLSDPLAYLSPPGSTTCTLGSPTIITGGTVTVNPNCQDVNVQSASANITFNPGVYHSITFGFSYTSGLDCGCYVPYGSRGPYPCGSNYGSYIGCLPSANVTFNPGTYSILGQAPSEYCVPNALLPYGYYSYGPSTCGLTITASGANITGTGVMFYNGPNAGSATIDGYWCSNGCTSNTINFAAPTTGEYAGILLYQDRSNTYNACIGGCYTFPSGPPSYFIIAGAMYVPDAGLYFTGCCEGANASQTYQITVANTLYFEFDNFYSDYASLPGGSPIKKTTLVE